MRSKKAIINIITSLLLQITTVICGLIVPRAIIAEFGSKVNGLIASITQFLGYITLLESGMGPVVKSVLYKPIAKKNKEEVEKILKAAEKFFRIIALIFVAYLIVLVIIYPYIVLDEFEIEYTVSLILIISISTFIEYFFGMVYKIYLQAEQETYIMSIIQVVTTIINAIIIIVLINLNLSVQMVKLVSALIFVIRPIFLNIYVKKKYKISLKDVKNDYKLKQKWDGLAQHIAAVIYTNTDVILLTVFCGVEKVSIYTVYLFVVNALRNIVFALIGGVDASFGDMIAKNEKSNLNRNFRIYELCYLSLITIFYSIAIVMIIPFVKVYTIGIADINYILPLFAYIFITAEFIWSTRQPYNELVKAAGHFKETRIGAWLEVCCNLIISIILIRKYELVGVAIGTLVAVIIRTLEFMYHTSKHILDRSMKYNLKNTFVQIVEILLIVTVGYVLIKQFNITSYITWLIAAMLVGTLALIVVGGVDVILYKEELKGIVEILKNIFKRKKEKGST